MKGAFSWAPHVLALELKKAFSYRVAFWVQFLMGSGTELVVSYFVWLSVFRATGVAIDPAADPGAPATIQGFTFHGLVFYSLFASLSAKITRGNDRGYVSQDIYDGGLTRYLLYPLPFFPYKYVTHFTQQLLGLAQLLVAFLFVYLALGDLGGHSITPFSFAAGVLTCLLTGYLHFVIAGCLELVAFWQDVIWNLMVMLRFCMSLLGGGMIPLAFFPEWGQRVAQLTPFPLLVSWPARTFLGQVGAQEWLANLGLLAFWSLLFTLLLNWIWVRGTKQYSGVGI